MTDFISATIGGVVLGFSLGMFTMIWLGMILSDAGWEHDTVERGLAQYCPMNGKWAWKGECDE